MFMLNYIYLVVFIMFLKLVHRFNQLQSRSNVMNSGKRLLCMIPEEAHCELSVTDEPLTLASAAPPPEFFWNGRQTAGIALKFCIANGESFAQLLAKN